MFRYIQWLLDSPLSDNLYIIVTSDHGEGLYEKYGDKILYGHSGKPYPEKIKIPMFLYGFGKGSADDLISVKDIMDIIYTIAESQTLSLPKNSVVRSEYYTNKREAAKKARYVASVEQDGTWNMRSFADTTKDDEASARTMSEDRINQLKVLGYLN